MAEHLLYSFFRIIRAACNKIIYGLINTGGIRSHFSKIRAVRLSLTLPPIYLYIQYSFPML